MKIISWILTVIAALIMLQSLYFKFSAQPESVLLFTTIGMEPWGRIGIGVMELIASILLFIPRTRFVGATLAAGLMAGAIKFHVTDIGLDFGGSYLLFAFAVIVLVCCLLIMLLERRNFAASWLKKKS